MGATRHLLVLSLAIAVCYSLDAPENCKMNMISENEAQNLLFDQRNRTGNIERFCLADAVTIRAEHFWCRGYIDEDGKVVEGTETYQFPTTSDDFWTVFLQFPALSWMDVARKSAVLSIIHDIVTSQDSCATGIPDYTKFCVSNVELYDVAEYSESVLVVLYNLGVSGEVFDQCFRSGFGEAGSDLVVRFRSKRAFRLSLNVSLIEMFSQNIGPASSIGNPDRDPTLRPIVLGSWPRNLTLSDARGMTSEGSFGSNPNPINYGLEAGDIVFAVFGSLFLVAVGLIVLLGFFIHPFFLS